MARPKYTENSVTAKERIENAFWALLAEHDYEKISIKMLAAEANVNHNSLYYYYDNIDAIAKSAFDHTVIKQLGLITKTTNITNLDQLKMFILTQPDIAARYQRIKLFASANSIYLQQLLKDGLLDTWLSQNEKSKETLSSLDLLELEFIFSAIVALLGRTNNPSDLDQFMHDELGQSVMRTMKRILS